MARDGIPEGVWIDRQDTLQDFLGAVMRAPWLALDTEFLRIYTYYPKLCLIQVSDGTRHALIDAQAGLDLSTFMEWLQKPDRRSVLHACMQDIEILHHDYDVIPEEVFDTQVAWALLGRDFQVSYAAMVENKLGLTLDKSQVRSRWDRRPLKPEQLQYALTDVVHLAPIYQQLAEDLEALGRLAWMREELKRMLTPATWVPDPEQIWKRVRISGGNLPADRLHVLQGLAHWRELTARRRDRARPKIATDETLTTLARTPPTNRKNFIRMVDGTVSERLHDKLWNALQEAQDRPPLAVKSIGRAERIEQRRQVRLLAAVARKVAEDLQVSPELLAPRAMLEALVQRQPNSTLLQGWRQQTVGPALTDALNAF